MKLTMFVTVCILTFSKLFAAENCDYFEAMKEPFYEGGRKQYVQMAEVNHLNKVLPHFAAGRIDYAVNELRFVLNAVANHPRALMLLSPVAKAAKNTNLGIGFFEKALKLYPQYAITHAQYGWYLVESANLEAGIRKLQQAIEMDAKLVAAHVWLAQAYGKSGNADLARQTAEQARELGYKGQIPGVN
jgi:Tfp pilus assembly protein PilF